MKATLRKKKSTTAGKAYTWISILLSSILKPANQPEENF